MGDYYESSGYLEELHDGGQYLPVATGRELLVKFVVFAALWIGAVCIGVVVA